MLNGWINSGTQKCHVNFRWQFHDDDKITIYQSKNLLGDMNNNKNQSFFGHFVATLGVNKTPIYVT